MEENNEINILKNYLQLLQHFSTNWGEQMSFELENAFDAEKHLVTAKINSLNINKLEKISENESESSDDSDDDDTNISVDVGHDSDDDKISVDVKSNNHNITSIVINLKKLSE